MSDLATWHTSIEQECIPVGCVPSAAVAAGEGGYVSQHALGREVCIPACTGQGILSGGGGCLPRGVSA